MSWIVYVNQYCLIKLSVSNTLFFVVYSTLPQSHNKITAELQIKTEIYSENFKLKNYMNTLVWLYIKYNTDSR